MKNDFAFSDARFCHDMRNNGSKILALTWICHLSMCLWSLGGIEESYGETPPIHEKISMSKIDLFTPTYYFSKH